MSELMKGIMTATVAAGPCLTRGRPLPKVFRRGPEVFPEMARLIRGAQREVLLQVFVWLPCKSQDTLLAALVDLQARLKTKPGTASLPVRVKFLVDGTPPGASFLKNALAQLHLDPRLVDVQVATFEHWGLDLLHSKSTVVDGRVGFVTGLNVQSEDDDVARPWNDLGFEVEGAQTAGVLREDFSRNWERATGHPLAPAPPTMASEVPDGSVPILVTSRRANGALGGDSDSPLLQSLVAAIDHSHREIHLVSPNINAPPILDAIVRAVRRGVTVKIVASARFNELLESLPFQGGPNGQTLHTLRERLRGVRNAGQLLQWRWYSDDGRKAVLGHDPGASHEKYYWFDGQVVSVGSANLDVQSMGRSAETNVMIDSSSVAQRYDEQAFSPIWERALRPLSNVTRKRARSR
jgi:phosphatidylserine/phosphatidylglycerophosphate/cardiolipin synthase-like enzyme